MRATGIGVRGEGPGPRLAEARIPPGDGVGPNGLDGYPRPMDPGVPGWGVEGAEVAELIYGDGKPLDDGNPLRSGVLL